MLYYGYQNLLNLINGLQPTLLAVEEKRKETSIKLKEDVTVKKQKDDWLINAILQSYKQLKQDFDAKTQS